MIRVFQIKCAGPAEIEKRLLAKLNMPKSDLLSWTIHRESVDARGQKVFFSYTVDAKVRHEKKYLKHKDVRVRPDERFRFEPEGRQPETGRPVVAGFGPAGMFAALLLAQYGYKPLIIERGAPIEQRQQDVDRFWKEGILDSESNVQFGEGGAGAFSDGKLTTRSKDILCRKVLQELVNLGARPEILYQQHPHIGTDAFVHIIKACRETIESLGGTFLFHTRLMDIETEEGRLTGIRINDGELIPCSALILAIGHSAGDTWRRLHADGLPLENKPFALGVRIEHDQTFIDKAMLGEAWQDPRLTPARYQMAVPTETGKGVYTFCMCPGGYVIPSSSNLDTVVVNGMSYAARDGQNANAALLVQVDEDDYGTELFGGLDLQEQVEKKAYELSGSYKAPAQNARDYLAGKISAAPSIAPTYDLGIEMADLHALFPDRVNAALEEGLRRMDEKVLGFLDGLMSAPETRSSSALRAPRDEHRMSAIEGVYPCGEGSGYAGGIVTSAVDGLHCAMELMDRYQKPEGEGDGTV